MKPITLCLVQMGEKGLELIKSYPNVLPKRLGAELAYKSMPIGAKPGEISSTVIGDIYFSSYIFKLPSTEGRDNIASIVAVFSSMKYDVEIIKKIFSVIVSELESKSLLKMEVLEEILPNLYRGFDKGQLRIKISSFATIEIDISTEEEEEKANETKALEEDLWK